MNTPQRPLVILLLLSLLSATACIQQELPGLNVAFPIPVPAMAGAMSPRLATSTNGITTLSWLEASDAGIALRYAHYAGDAWQEAATAVTDTDMFVNWADRAAVTPLGKDTYIAHWLRHSGAHDHAYDILTSVSRDGGSSWSEPARPHNDDTPTEHGFVSVIATDAGANLLWLDGRETTAGTHASSPAHGMTLRSATLNRSGPVTHQTVVDDLVCDCCPTDAVDTAAGPIAVYRNRTAEEIRDIYVTRRIDGQWQPGVALSDDNWKIAGCPVNGPSIAANDRLVAIGWFSAANDEPQVKAAYSSNGGKSFSAPVTVAAGRPLGQVGSAVIGDRSFAISWLESNGDGTYMVNVRTLTTDGQISEVVKAGRTKISRQVPELARVNDKLIVVWTDRYKDANKIVSVQLPIVNFYDL